MVSVYTSEQILTFFPHPYVATDSKPDSACLPNQTKSARFMAEI